MSWPDALDRPLIEVLCALPEAPARGVEDPAALAARAELHGVTGVIQDVLFAATEPSTGASKLRERLSRATVARELDHAAHLAMLRRLDEVLSAAKIEAVALKGALLAQRYYLRPAARATSDIDLLVREADLVRAAHAITDAGYRAHDGPEEERFRREHHHLHFGHAHALPLELHFHAYRGFGTILRSEPLVERSVRCETPPLDAIHVLAPEDELTFLAVHGAAHRYVRLGWLYDLRLLVDRMSEESLERTGRAARASGFARPVALAATLLASILGVDRRRLRPLGALGRLREPLVRGLVGEPRDPWIRSATRLVYTTALCDSPAAAIRYASSASRGHARRILAPLGAFR